LITAVRLWRGRPAQITRAGWPLHRYLVALVLLFVLAAGAGVWYAWFEAKHDALAAAGEDAAFGARLAAKQLGDDIAVVQASVGQLAASPAIAQAFTDAGTDDGADDGANGCRLSFSLGGGTGDGHLDVVRPDGVVTCSSRPLDEMEDAGYAEADWLAGALQAPGLAGPTLDARTGRQALVVSTPVPGRGAVVAFLDLEALGSALANLFGGPRGLEFLVATPEGAIVTRWPDPQRWIGASAGSAQLPAQADGGAGTDVSGTARVYGQSTVAQLGWRVYAGADRAEATASAVRLAWRQGLVVGAGLLVALVATLVVNRRITRPVRRLSQAVRAGSATAEPGPVEVAGPREVAGLAADFNDLVAAVNRELAERRRAEETARELQANYRQLFDANPYPILVFDTATSAILAANDAAVGYYGHPRERLLQRSLAGLSADAEAEAQVAAVATAGSVQRLGPLRQTKHDGTTAEVNVVSHALRFASRDVRCAVIEDITEREQLERRQRQSQRLESLGHLASGVAHDFNNLLGIIIGYATMAATDVETVAATEPRWQALRDDLGQIVQAGDRATALTRQLLAFARAEVAQPQVLDLNAVVADIERLLRRTIGADVDLRTRLADRPLGIRADPGQIEQILVNLAVNARDAMPTGGTLTIETDPLTVDDHYAAHRPGLRVGSYARLRVSDTGTGMSQDVLDRAFEPFFTTKPRGQGTGLGLATIYGIVTQAGGHAQIYSESGRGTTFTALLPATDEPAAAPEPTAGAQQPGDGETILVVEDDDGLRALTERILTRHNYTVLAAGTAAEASRLADDSDRFDLLLTDVVMPDADGHELATQLVAAHPGLPVIYMSGYTETVLAARSTLPPGVTLLTKPVTEHQLLIAVRRVLNASTAGRGGR
jgi:PAS domain S-box-containing protein